VNVVASSEAESVSAVPASYAVRGFISGPRTDLGVPLSCLILMEHSLMAFEDEFYKLA
jgi:hypothetical protein